MWHIIFFQTREYFLSLHFLIWFNILEHLKNCLIFSRAPLLIFSHKTFAKDLCPSLWKCFLGQILTSKSLSKYYSWKACSLLEMFPNIISILSFFFILDHTSYRKDLIQKCDLKLHIAVTHRHAWLCGNFFSTNL